MSSNKYLGYFIFSIFLLVTATSCVTDSNNTTADYSIAEDFIIDTEGLTPDTTDTGLIIYYVEEGIEPFEATARDNILLHYIIRLKENDRIFESSYVNGSTQAFQFQVLAEMAASRGEHIVEGIVGMRKNERRVLVIPPDDDLVKSLFVDTVIVDLELDTILY